MKSKCVDMLKQLKEQGNDVYYKGECPECGKDTEATKAIGIDNIIRSDYKCKGCGYEWYATVGCIRIYKK